VLVLLGTASHGASLQFVAIGDARRSTLGARRALGLDSRSCWRLSTGKSGASSAPFIPPSRFMTKTLIALAIAFAAVGAHAQVATTAKEAGKAAVETTKQGVESAKAAASDQPAKAVHKVKAKVHKAKAKKAAEASKAAAKEAVK
jgi:hypothetical protein